MLAAARRWYETDRRHVHYITGLLPDMSNRICGSDVNRMSRWLKTEEGSCSEPTRTCDEPDPGSLIELSGGNDNSATDLAACTGECDSDAQCAAGLLCFQRSDNETIPGCKGPGGGRDWDYCYNTSGLVELSGGDDNSATDLAACTGECDSDAQCAAGLRCFQRSNGETIPGCFGPGGGRNWDYCYDPCIPQEHASSVLTAINSSDGAASPSIRDISITGPCGGALRGASISDKERGGCWRHVHPETGNVYDFSYWVSAHEGIAREEQRYNPVAAPAREGKAYMTFPDNICTYSRTDMRCWSDYKRYFQFVGLLDETLAFSALPLPLQTAGVAPAGAVGTRRAEGFEACGSRRAWIGVAGIGIEVAYSF